MTSIQFVNTLTNKQWETVYQDVRFDENYRKTAGNQEELANELISKIKKICTQLNTVPPTKVRVTYDTPSELKLDAGELRIHPLTFAACKLDKNQMSSEHQELYKELKNCITDTGVLITQNKQPVDNKKQPQPLISARDSLLQHMPKLNENFKKYEYIIPSGELDHRIMTLMDIEGELNPTVARTSVENLIKISYVSVSILSGISIGWVTNKFTPDTLYWPVMGFLGVLTARWTWKSLKKSDVVSPFLAQSAFKLLRNHELINKSWNRLSPEAKLLNAKYEAASRMEKFLVHMVLRP